MATMLDCKNIQPRISEYIDGDCDADAAWQMKLHLASCAVCTQVAAELTATTRLLGNLPELAPSASFEAALARRLADQVLKPRQPSLFDRFSDWWLRPTLRRTFASAAAAMAVFVPAALIVSHHGRTVAVPGAHGVDPASAASDPALSEIWNEHLTYASSEPLADSTGMLQGRTGNPASQTGPDTL